MAEARAALDDFERLPRPRHADARGRAAADARVRDRRASRQGAGVLTQARGRGARAARPRPVESRDLRPALHQPQDGRAPRRQRPRQARPAQPGGGGRATPTRDETRPRIGDLPDAPSSRRARLVSATNLEDRRMAADYDAIVVGARCAGAPTAMLLARQGYRVLLVDRATFPSDTVSTHSSTRPASPRCAAGVSSTRSPRPAARRSTRYSFDFGPFTIAGHAAARRRHLDRLRPAADRARQDPRRRRRRGRRRGPASSSPSTSSLVEDGAVVGIRGRDRTAAPSSERARVVIGADGAALHGRPRGPGRRSTTTKPMLQWRYYTYWSDLPVDGFEIVIRPDRGWAALPTNDGLTLLVVGWPYAESAAYKADVEAQLPARPSSWRPTFAERVRGRDPRGAVRRRGGPQLLPHALRTRVGAGRRRRLHQGPDHRPGHQRRLPRRRAVRDRPRRSASPATAVRSRDGRLPADPRRGSSCRSTSSPPSPRWSHRRRRCSCWRGAGNQAAMDCSPASSPAPSRRRILRPRQHRPHHGRCLGGLAGVPHSSSVDRSGHRDRGPTSRRRSASRPRPGTTGHSRLSATRG